MRAKISGRGGGGGGDGAAGSGPGGALTAKEAHDALTRMKPRLVPIKIEPKTFFANERTFIHWMTASVLLITLAMALLTVQNDEDAIRSGWTIFPIAFLFIWYALGRYLWRAAMIRKRAAVPYDDRFGPPVLVLMLSVAMGLNAYIRFSRIQALLPRPLPPASGIFHAQECAQLLSARNMPLFYRPGSAAYVPSLGAVAVAGGNNMLGLYSLAADTFRALPAPVALANSPGFTSFNAAFTISNGAHNGSVFWAMESSFFETDANGAVLTAPTALPAPVPNIKGGTRLWGAAWVPAGPGPLNGTLYVTGEYALYGVSLAVNSADPRGPYNVAVKQEIRYFEDLHIWLNVTNCTDIAYDAADDVMYLVSANNGMLHAFQLPAWRWLGNWTLPGTGVSWFGVGVKHAPGDAHTTMYLAQETPGEVWALQFDRATGFPPCAPGNPLRITMFPPITFFTVFE